jgi:hypothetical protein
MHRSTQPAMLLIAAAVFTASILSAQTKSPQKINACSLLPASEVKKHLPWDARLDQFPPEEIAVGTDGSSCEYASVGIQVLPLTSRILETAKQRGRVENVSGIGSEALFYVNPNGYAELYVRTNKHVLTLQADSKRGVDAVKPGVLSLAKALVAKL